MRTPIGIGEDRIQALNARELSRAALIREAVDAFLGQHRQARAQVAFGLGSVVVKTDRRNALIDPPASI